MGLTSGHCPHTGKVQFTRKADALATLVRRRGEGAAPVAVYRCPWCLFWHLTHQRQHVRDRRTHRRDRSTADD